MPEKPTRKLTILGMDVEHEGRRKNDNQPYTIYNVTALGEDGQPIEQRLRTFDGELPQNQLITVEVEHRKDERHGETFTISLPGKKKGLADSVDELRKSYDDLLRRFNEHVADGHGATNGSQSLATPPGGGPTF